MHARVRERVHFFHHKRRCAPFLHCLPSPTLVLHRISHPYSFGEMSAGKAKDGQWGRHPVRHDITRVRELCGGAENLSGQISRGELVHSLLFGRFAICVSLGFPLARLLSVILTRNSKTQSTRGDNQPRPGSGYGVPQQSGSASGSTSAPNPPSSTTAFHAPTEGVNNILSPHGLEASEQDHGSYANVYPASTGNGAEPY